MKVKLLFAWYDLWVGLFWDKKKKWLYILPFPCLGIILKFGFPENYWINEDYSSYSCPYNLWYKDEQVGGFKTKRDARNYAYENNYNEIVNSTPNQ